MDRQDRLNDASQLLVEVRVGGHKVVGSWVKGVAARIGDETARFRDQQLSLIHI